MLSGYFHIQGNFILKTEISVLENFVFFPVFIETGDFQVGCAHHEINVNHRLVDSFLVQLFLSHVFITLYQVCKAFAECDMTACVLVKKGVVVGYTLIVYRAVVTHQRHFAEAA